MKEILKNEKKANSAIADHLGVKSLEASFKEDIKRIECDGPNLDSNPAVLGTAWTLFQGSPGKN